jgi:hypothetical protein
MWNMADSLDKLWLKGKAEEDMYIAKRERELSEAQRKKKRRKKPEDADNKTIKQDKQKK